MTADLRQTFDPDVLAGFAARGIDEAQAAELLSKAQAELSAAEMRYAVETLAQTRVLTWPECMRFAQLHRPLP